MARIFENGAEERQVRTKGHFWTTEVVPEQVYNYPDEGTVIRDFKVTADGNSAKIEFDTSLVGPFSVEQIYMGPNANPTTSVGSLGYTTVDCGTNFQGTTHCKLVYGIPENLLRYFIVKINSSGTNLFGSHSTDGDNNFTTKNEWFKVNDTADMPRTGTQFYEIALDTNGPEDTYVQQTISGAPTSVSLAFGMRIQFPSGITDSTSIPVATLNFGSGETIKLAFSNFVTTSGVDYVDFTATATNGVNTATLTKTGIRADQYNTFCLRTTVDTGSGATESFTLRVNEDEQTSSAVNFATAGLSSFRIGAYTVTATTNNTRILMYYDDIILDNTNVNISKNRVLEPLIVDAEGTNQQWSGGVSQVTDNNLGSSSYISATGETQKTQDFTLRNLTGNVVSTRAPVNAVFGVEYGDDLDTVGFTLSLLDSDNNVLGSASLASSTSRINVHNALVVDVTGKTQAYLDGCYIRLVKSAGLASDQVTVWKIWGYVEMSNEQPTYLCQWVFDDE